jgi:hypothetical protein
MADTNTPNKNMISGMETALTLSGDEFVEVVRLMPDGSYKNYRTLASKLRVGKTAYDLAVDNGFVGTEAQWLETLVGASAYEIAVRVGEFVGTEADWVKALEALYKADPLRVGQVLTADAQGVGVFKQLTPADVGLTHVNDTADADKPVSEPQRTEFSRYLLRSRTTTEVMKVLLALPGIRYTSDMKDIIFDEGHVNPVAP